MAGFLLLPIAGQIRDGALANWPARDLAVLVALAAHENARTRLAWPSLSRLACLAGVRKMDVRPLLKRLEATHWIARAPGTQPRWRMLWSVYPGNLPPRDWLRVDRALALGGVWSAMTPSARALYFVMKSLSWVGHKADLDWPCGLEEADPACWESIDFQFLSAGLLDPGTLARLAGLTPPTFRRARSWLMDNGLAFPTDAGQKPGLVLPFDPHLVAPAVLEALERDKAEATLPKGHALRAFRAAQKAASKNGLKSASSKRALIGEPRALIGEPLSAHQGTIERLSGNGNDFLSTLDREINELNDPSAPWEGADATATG